MRKKDEFMNHDLFVERFTSLRHQKGLSKKDVWKRINTIQEKLGLSLSAYTTICSWEKGRNPSIQMRPIIAEALDCSIDYLMGFSKSTGVKELDMEMYNSLVDVDINDLSNYNGQPVFVTYIAASSFGFWGLIDAENRKITRADGSSISYLCNNYKYHVMPPAFTLSYSAIQNTPVSLGTAKNAEKVWIELVGEHTMELKEYYKGWYYYHEPAHCFVRLDTVCSLPEQNFGVSYLAYKDNDYFDSSK